MAGCDVFMSNLNVILSKVEELSEIRQKVNKVKKNSGPGLLGDILDEPYVKDLLKDLGDRAKTKVEEFQQLRVEKEQEMEEYFLEGDDEKALERIIEGQREAKSLVEEIEVLLSCDRQVTSDQSVDNPDTVTGGATEDLAPNQGEIEQNVIGGQENEGVSARDITVEDTEGAATREDVGRGDQGTSESEPLVSRSTLASKSDSHKSDQP